jgi:hypothetical protein
MRETFFMGGTTMRRIFAVFITTASLFAWTSRAQDTITNLTELEAFEAQTGTVIVKGAGQTGSLTIGAVDVAVLSKESLNVTTGQKAYGVAIEITENNRLVRKAVIDYDELDTFLSSLDYLARIDYNVTTLPTFTASYTTKSGFRVGAFTSQRRGAIQFFLQSYNTDKAKILITPAQLIQFQTLVEQTRKSLDALRTPR